MIDELVLLKQGLLLVEQTLGPEKFHFEGEPHLATLAGGPDDQEGYRSPAVSVQRAEVRWKIQTVKERLAEFAPSRAWYSARVRERVELWKSPIP